MTKDEVVNRIKQQFEAAYEGATMKGCPPDLEWEECRGRDQEQGALPCSNGGGVDGFPWVFKACDKNGVGHAIGIARQVPLLIISYGRVGVGKKTCCQWRPSK